MRSRSLSVLIALSTLTGCFVREARPAENHAARNGYVYLGERWVRGGGQAVHEAIGGLRNDGRFRSIMLVIEHAPVEVYDLVVTFGDNQTFRPGTRLTFGPDSATREIDLPGGDRIIRRVDFVVANLPGDGRAKLELWAR